MAKAYHDYSINHNTAVNVIMLAIVVKKMTWESAWLTSIAAADGAVTGG